MYRVTALVLAVLVASLSIPSSAQTVRDSVQMEIKVYKFDRPETATGRRCGAGVYAVWPNVLQDILGSPDQSYGYADYGRLLVDGGTIPQGGVEAVTNEDLNLVVAGGDVGYFPGIASSGGYGPNTESPCSRFYAGADAVASGAWTILNGQAFRIYKWYATFNVPDGTPIALFEWEPGDGLAIDFDASFESDQSREIDVTAPAKKVPVASYAWDFGDGESGTGAKPSHEYADPGEYEVTLTVTDDDGETASRTETVTVDGVALTVEVEMATEEVTAPGDTILVRGTVTNTSTEPVLEVRVQRQFFYTYRVAEDSLNKSGSLLRPPTLKELPVPDGEDPVVTRASLAPGESVEITREYLVEEAGAYRESSRVPYAPENVLLDWTGLGRVEGETTDMDSVPIRQKCEGVDPACATTLVKPLSYNIAVEFRKDNQFTTEGLAGLRYNPQLNSPRAEVQAFDYTEDGEPFCSTACVDVLVEVTADSGDPIADAEVTLKAAAIPDSSNVTPDHTGGHFCTQMSSLSGWVCDKELTATADDDGKLRAIYSFPGVINDVEVPVTVSANAPSSSGPPTEVEEELRVRANVEHESTVQLNGSQAAYLNASGLTVIGGAIASPMGETCEYMLKGIADPSVILQPSDSPILFSVANATAEWACAFNPLSFWQEDAPGTAKKVGETNLFLQFNYLHRPPSRGLFTMSPPRPGPLGTPIVTADGDYYSDAIGAMTQAVAQDLIREGTTVKVKLTEVSWIRELSSPVGRLEVFAMHMRIDVTSPSGVTKRFDSVLQNQYIADIHLLPPTGRARLQAQLRAQEEQARLRDLLERVNEGDYLVFLNSDPLNTETNQVSDASAEGRVSAPKGGNVDQIVGLVAPLRFDHDSDTQVLVIDGSGAATPPGAPIVMSADTLGTARAYPFRWVMGLTPASHYQIEIARDTLFADIVDSDSEVVGPEFSFQATTDNETLYWRVRGVNSLGEGPWSRRGRVEVIDAVSTAADRDEPSFLDALSVFVYPNPASRLARLAVESPTSGPQRVVLYDALGRQVSVLVNEERPAGRHELAIQVSGLQAGSYIVRVEAAGDVATQRLTVVR